MKVIVVESPTKAKKIQSYFKEYKVISSCGHIYDLSKKTLSIDIDNNFKPIYQPVEGKQKIIKYLKSFSNQDILLAADDDREGDAIAWHCANVMNVNLNENNRIKFHEVSKKALLNAINNPEKLDINSVNTQQARRIIDRLIGFRLSPLLWKHIDTNDKGLSAGRVQSTLLYLIDKHEKDILKHTTQYSNTIDATFDNIYKTKFISQKEFLFQDIFDVIKLSRNFSILDQKHITIKKYPHPPFITSTLQRTALKELGFNVKTTSNIAQKLYENGKITYIRTDSPNVSLEFQQTLHEFISDHYDQDLFIRPDSNKSVIGAQEAHECIRIININDKLTDDIFNNHDKRLYGLIYKNTICSHMKPALYDRLIYKFSNNHFTNIGHFKGSKDILIYDGYLRFSNSNLEISKSINDLDNINYIMTSCVYSNIPNIPKSHPDESSIIKLLETSGIGRPSTYASIVANVYNRNYTEVITIPSYKIPYDKYILNNDNSITQNPDEKIIPLQKNKIILTDLGKKILGYLNDHFNHIINPRFTQLVEKDLDLINNGKIEWVEVVRKVYNSFIDNVNVQMKINKPKNNYYKRNLGKFNKKDILLLQGQYGYFIKYNNKNTNIDKLLKLKNPDLISITDLQDFKLI